MQSSPALDTNDHVPTFKSVLSDEVIAAKTREPASAVSRSVCDVSPSHVPHVSHFRIRQMLNVIPHLVDPYLVEEPIRFCEQVDMDALHSAITKPRTAAG